LCFGEPGLESFFRGVNVELNMPAPCQAVVKLTGFEKQHRLIGFSVIGFYRKALEVFGAKDIKAEHTTSIEDDKGYCELVLNWNE